MNNKLSKTLSFILRHKPEDFGLTMNQYGWVNVQSLVDALGINIPTLVGIVNEDSKGRYEFASNTTVIRATQGHSRPVDLSLIEFPKPLQGTIFHGTAERFVSSIIEQGILKGSRQYVHLSTDTEVAKDVGGRHGKPVVLVLDTDQMYEDGIKFYQSVNNVVLCDYVDPKYIKFLEE